jgi:hypothetical protein
MCGVCIDCRFCSSKLSPEEAVRPSNGVRDVCAGAECQAKSVICCEKTLACGCACNGIKNEAVCLPCLKHDLKIDEDEYCGVSGRQHLTGLLAPPSAGESLCIDVRVADVWLSHVCLLCCR